MSILDNIDQIGRIDMNNMLTLISDFPVQFQKAVDLVRTVEVPHKYKKKEFRNILFCGMGGSAIGAHILIAFLKKELSIPVEVNRDYTIPEYVGADTLAIFCSYSGNTEETISAYEKVRNRTSYRIIISSNGKLMEKIQEDEIFGITIPTGYPPRAGLGYSFLSLLLLISKMGLINSKQAEIYETIEILKYLVNEKLGLDVKFNSNLAKQIAGRCYEKFPVIYGASDCLEPVILRWRTQLAENSKMLSSTHVFPEMNHNEIVGWKFPKRLMNDFIAMFLRDACEHERVAKRIEITKEILEDNNIKTLEVNSVGKSLLARLFSLIYIGDFVSFYLAILNEENPTPVGRIDYLKQNLAQS